MSLFRQLDELLRGEKTVPGSLSENRVDLPLKTFVSLAIVLGGVYGFFMGWYAVLNREPVEYTQVLASVIKLPALFLLTLIITFPSLYVFNALVGCRMTFIGTLRLLVGAIVVNVTVAASLGPILAFFTLCTASYPFMVVLNVALLSVSGFVALGFLLHTLRRIVVRQPIVNSDPIESFAAADSPEFEKVSSRAPGALEQVSRDDREFGPANVVFKIWILLYGLVGAQMGWVLRPFIGAPDLPFQWFRERQGNFFLSVIKHLQDLFGSG